MIRALHVINGRFFGGGHRSTLLLMRALDEGGAAQTQLCTLGEGGALPLNGRVPMVVPFDGRYNNPKVLIGTALKLRKLIKAQRPDIVHTHGLDADLIGSLAVMGLSARHISHLRITPVFDANESWRVGMRRRLFRWLTALKGTRFIAVSEAVRQQMAKYYRIAKERIVTVRNGVDLTAFDGSRAEPDTQSATRTLQIGSAGRLAPMKGFEYLLDAAALVNAQGIEFRLHLAGSGSELVALRARADSLGIGGQVHFPGQLEDMRDYYRQLDLFVLPSVSTEGLPLVVLEASAMGVPVIATDLAGAPEVIDDGENGLLVPICDAQALAQAMRRMATDDALRDRLAQAGLARVRRDFSVQRVAVEVAVVYADLLKLRLPD